MSHIVVVWLENHEYGSVTSSSMPYLTGLGAQYGLASGFYGVTHPSLPNYLAVWSGSTHAITDDQTHNLTGPTIASQMDGAGLSWRAYMQDYPSSGCYTGSSYSDSTPDGWGVNGTYVRKHDPPMSFTAVSGNATECAKVQPLHTFSGSPNLAFVAPNLCNDAHDCSLTTADNFLKAFVPVVFNTTQYQAGSLALIISFDEGTTNTNGGGHIYTVVARKGMAHKVSSTFHNHYGLLRTIENTFGLPCLGSACSAAPLSEFVP